MYFIALLYSRARLSGVTGTLRTNTYSIFLAQILSLDLWCQAQMESACVGQDVAASNPNYRFRRRKLHNLCRCYMWSEAEVLTKTAIKHRNLERTPF